jgi:hypothetical protein
MSSLTNDDLHIPSNWPGKSKNISWHDLPVSLHLHVRAFHAYNAKKHPNKPTMSWIDYVKKTGIQQEIDNVLQSHANNDSDSDSDVDVEVNRTIIW